MSREIKYRAWGGGLTDKRMFSSEELGADQLTLSVDGRGFVNVAPTLRGSVFYGDKMIPLQFTGLLDKNGKEIYEGDIVRLSGENYYSNETLSTDEDWDVVGVAKWEPSLFAWYFRIDTSLIPFWDVPNEDIDTEVIGNIYESSQLLKQVDQ